MRTTKTALVFFTWIGFAAAQAPNGSIAGVVRDPSGAAVAGAQVKAANTATGLTRTNATSEQGDYGIPALPAGEYEVSVEAAGFQRAVRRAVVEAGGTTSADFNLRVGDVKESVTVEGASPQMRYDSHSVGGMVTQSQVQGLPLNGRSFLELAKLEPGVQPPSRTTQGRTFLVVLGGGNGRETRVTVDGGTIMSAGYGGSQMGFSQEVVQEFQISTVNFDLSTGITGAGAVNVVTRSGGNDLHAAGFYFYRDHQTGRLPRAEPRSQQPGPVLPAFALGGPIRRDRVFFFGNWERNEQRGVVATTLLAPDFAHFSRITTSPLFSNQFSIRLDGRISNAHTAFVRHSHDGSRAFAPEAAGLGLGPAAYPSSWNLVPSWADQSVLGITSVLRPTLVNELRFSYFFFSSKEIAPLPGIAGVSGGRQLDFRGAPTLFTGADLVSILPAIRADKVQSLANADPSVQAIQVSKQASARVYPAQVPSPSSLHAGLGVQREITREFVVSGDFVYRHFVHTQGPAIDLNRFRSTRGRVIPACTSAQGQDPHAICSLGPINVNAAPYRSTYKGLLLRAEKRFSHGFQALGSYAYASNTGTNTGNGFNLDNWLENTGPLQTDITQILNLAGVVHLAGRFELGLNFSYSSAPPFRAYVGAIDFNGDGTTGDLLPGTTVNAFNRGTGREDLERLVAQFNSIYGGTRDSQGRSIPRLTLPSVYSFGDNFHSLDLRLSRSFAFRERWRLSLIGEVFNLYNGANLSGYSGDLTNAGFGQPTSRATQVFGSGGPRAFQLAMRVSF